MTHAHTNTHTQPRNATRRTRPAARAATLRRALAAALTCLTATLTPHSPADAGPGLGGATEFTQLLNNAELISLVGLESETLSVNTRQLLSQANLLRTQMQAYQNMLRNTANLPQTHWGDVVTSLTELRGVMASAQAIASDGARLDRLMSGRLVADPLYRAAPVSEAEFASRYDAWNGLSRNALEAALGTARMTVADVASEADLIRVITEQGKTARGQVEAIQIGNELSASVVRQLSQLRMLTAAQSEQTSLFQARWMAERDAEEAWRRETVRRAEERAARRAPGQNIIGSFTREAP